MRYVFNRKKTNLCVTQSNPRAEVIVMFNEYLSAPIIEDYNINPLDFWKTYDKFPVLRDLAVRLLGIPASSTASERTFSAAGYTVSSRRANLSSAHVEEILFINRNAKFIK